jgi:ADP-ribose pyrophosphatase
MIVPENAEKVFEGVLFDVYQWKQKMYDGNFATFEKLVRKASVEMIAVVDNKIIVLKQKQPGREEGFYGLPAGRVDSGEEMQSAAERELLEETGYQANKTELLVEFFGNSKLYFHEQVFVTREPQKVAEQKLDGGEKIEVEFWTFDKWLQLCRDITSVMPFEFRMMMYEALLDKKKKERLKKKIFEGGF